MNEKSECREKREFAVICHAEDEVMSEPVLAPDMSDAYCNLAMLAIPMARNAMELREWWRDEQAHREQYGLSHGQVARLVEMCRQRISGVR